MRFVEDPEGESGEERMRRQWSRCYQQVSIADSWASSSEDSEGLLEHVSDIPPK